MTPNIYRIPLPLPNEGLRAVNAYALVDERGVDLIDSGWALPQSRESLASGLRMLDRSLGDIRQFLVTHVHPDHYTQAVAIRRDFGTKVSLGVGESDSLRMLQATDSVPFDALLKRLSNCGAKDLAVGLAEPSAQLPPFNRSEWASPDEWLKPGAITLASGRSLEVIATPGHTQGHVVFRDSIRAPAIRRGPRASYHHADYRL